MVQFTYPDGITILEENGYVMAVQDFELTHLPVQETDSIKQCHREIQEYLAGQRTDFSVAYKLKGTEFQIKVWEAIAQIPYGEMRSYRAIADMIHHPRASRAVGSACNRCPLSFLIPCHRVVSSQGIGGFGSDLSEKIRLLELESRVSGTTVL